MTPIFHLHSSQPRLATNKINKHGVVCWPVVAHQVLKLLQQKPQQCSATKTVEYI